MLRMSGATDPSAAMYAPRRSNRVTPDLTQADGDTWREKITVCESVTPTGEPKLTMRSYFKNVRTEDKVWDEPPSGASNIKFASPRDRKKAEDRLQSLQLTLDMIPPEEQKKQKTGFLVRFKKNNEKKKQVDSSQDLQLQRALAQSMMEQHGTSQRRQRDSPDEKRNVPSVPNPSRRGPKDIAPRYQVVQDDDDIAMAKALSMSEESQKEQMSEEEMLMRAIEESRLEAEQQTAGMGLASLPVQKHSIIEYEATMIPPSSDMSLYVDEDDDDDDCDAKMPAQLNFDDMNEEELLMIAIEESRRQAEQEGIYNMPDLVHETPPRHAAKVSPTNDVWENQYFETVAMTKANKREVDKDVSFDPYAPSSAIIKHDHQSYLSEMVGDVPEVAPTSHKSLSGLKQPKEEADHPTMGRPKSGPLFPRVFKGRKAMEEEAGLV